MQTKKPRKKVKKREAAITVGGVTFTAKQVERAVVKIDGREVEIGEKEEKKRRMGF